MNLFGEEGGFEATMGVLRTNAVPPTRVVDSLLESKFLINLALNVLSLTSAFIIQTRKYPERIRELTRSFLTKTVFLGSDF